MKQRLIFIDVIRAYAICMMLQGHFITALLAEPYCDESNPYYHIWHISQVLPHLYSLPFQALSLPICSFEKASAVV